jgi:hypothetical protein
MKILSQNDFKDPSRSGRLILYRSIASPKNTLWRSSLGITIPLIKYCIETSLI